MIDGNHECFRTPPDAQVIWRYMDLARFLAMVQSRSIWLSRLDLLGDPHEGAVGRPNVNARQALRHEMEQQIVQTNPTISDDERAVILDRFELTMTATRVSSREWIYVSCWHMNSGESAAMWSLYQSDGRGIAVRSTVGRMRDALRDDPTPDMFLGEVGYVDYASTLIPEQNLFWPAVFKRHSFEHEREVRLVTMVTPPAVPDPTNPADGRLDPLWQRPSGVNVPIVLERLIDAVYVAPNTPSWFGDVVRRALKDSGLDIDVRQSAMDAGPLF